MQKNSGTEKVSYIGKLMEVSERGFLEYLEKISVNRVRYMED